MHVHINEIVMCLSVLLSNDIPYHSYYKLTHLFFTHSDPAAVIISISLMSQVEIFPCLFGFFWGGVDINIISLIRAWKEELESS